MILANLIWKSWNHFNKYCFKLVEAMPERNKAIIKS